MFTSSVTADCAMWCLPSAGSRCGGPESVPVLVGVYPVEIHGLALEHLTKSAGYLDDFSGISLRDVVVPEVTEMHPAAARSVGGVNYSPTLLAMPLSNCPHGLHIPTLRAMVALDCFFSKESRRLRSCP